MKTDEEIAVLEKEYEDLCKKVSPQIQEKLAAAAKLISEATKLSEEHGIPFRPAVDIMWCNPSYIPSSLAEKHPDLEEDFISDVAGAWGGGDYPGWQQSQTC